MGRLDGSDARRRDRVRVRPPAQREPQVHGERARARPQNDHGLLYFRPARVSPFLSLFCLCTSLCLYMYLFTSIPVQRDAFFPAVLLPVSFSQSSVPLGGMTPPRNSKLSLLLPVSPGVSPSPSLCFHFPFSHACGRCFIFYGSESRAGELPPPYSAHVYFSTLKSLIICGALSFCYCVWSIKPSGSKILRRYTRFFQVFNKNKYWIQ